MNIKVGIASIIFNKHKQILLGKRKGVHGHKTWAPPGGHLKFREDPIACATREAMEEAGIEITNITAGPWTNDIFKEDDVHYISLFMIANHKSGVPKVLEPDKCEIWQWWDLDNLPEPLFLPLLNLNNSGYDLVKLTSYLTF